MVKRAVERVLWVCSQRVRVLDGYAVGIGVVVIDVVVDSGLARGGGASSDVVDVGGALLDLSY